MNEPDISPQQRRRVFVVLFISIFVTMAGVGIIAPYLPIYAKELGASGTMIGMIFAGFSMARLVLMPIFGRWSDKKGRKIFIAVGFLFYTAISGLFILASSAWELMVVRMLHGASAAMILPIAMAYIGEISKDKHEARSMNFITIALFMGFGVGPLAGGFIHDSLGIALNFASLGVASFIAFLLVVFFLPNLKMNEFCGGKNKEPSKYREIFSNRIMRGIVLFRLSNALGRGCLMAFMPLLASVKLGLNSVQIGVIISCNLVLSGALQTVFGKMADKVDRVKMAAIGNLFAAVALLMIPFSRNIYELFLTNLAMGISGAVTIPAASGIVVSEGKKHFSMGSVMSLYNMAMSMGLAAGPLLGGLIQDATNIINVFVFASATAVLGTILLVWYLKKPAGKLEKNRPVV